MTKTDNERKKEIMKSGEHTITENEAMRLYEEADDKSRAIMDVMKTMSKPELERLISEMERIRSERSE